MGVSRDAQLRAFQLIKAVLQEEKGKDLFEFGYKTMRERWERLNQTLSNTRRFSYELVGAQYCNFFRTVRQPSPGK